MTARNRTFEGYTPPARDYPDAAPWIAARIEEAPYPADDQATTIEGPFGLSPVIVDPSDPPTYSFSTTGATLAEGWYRVVWADGDGVEQATQWYEYRAVPVYAPSVGDIATLLRARAVEAGGHPVTTFTDHTNPTAQEIQNLIALFTPGVFARLGRLDNLGCANASELRSAARLLAAQRVALEVEATYWPEEVAESAPVEARRAMLEADLDGLVGALETCRTSSDDGDTGGESESRADPAWRFPSYRPLRF